MITNRKIFVIFVKIPIDMNYTEICKIPLFRSIEEKAMEELFSRFTLSETAFEKGEILAMQDEPCNRLIVLLTGSVSAEMSDPSGKVVKVEDIEAPNPLAILFLFGKENRFPVQVTTREAVTALIIPKQSLLKMLGESETMLKNYLDISAEFAARLSRKLHMMSFRTIRQKLALYLLELSKKAGSKTIRLPKSKSELAEYFGVSRPALERELTHMEKDLLILSERRKITLTNPEELFRLVHFK